MSLRRGRPRPRPRPRRLFRLGIFYGLSFANVSYSVFYNIIYSKACLYRSCLNLLFFYDFFNCLYLNRIYFYVEFLGSYNTSYGFIADSVTHINRNNFMHTNKSLMQNNNYKNCSIKDLYIIKLT